MPSRAEGDIRDGTGASNMATQQTLREEKTHTAHWNSTESLSSHLCGSGAASMSVTLTCHFPSDNLQVWL